MKIAIGHINSAAVAPLNVRLNEIAPEIDSTIFLNEQPLNRINAAGFITAQATQDFARLLFDINTEQYDAILIGCSMFSAKASEFQPFFDIPVIGIDQAMIEYVAHHFQKIGVLATNQTASRMTTNQIVDEGSNDIRVIPQIAAEANRYLKASDLDSYTNSIYDAAKVLVDKGVEILVLAQVSMTISEKRLADLNLPIISSPKFGWQNLLDEVNAVNQIK